MTTILKYPDIWLRKTASQVESVDDKSLGKVLELGEKLATERAVGLAATQMGFEERFFGIKLAKKEVEIFVNPTFVAISREKSVPVVRDGEASENFLEGCLSFPKLWGEVERFIRIKAEWQKIVDGRLVNRQREMEGLEAVVYQHELDHLDGVLFVDHVMAGGGKIYRDEEGEMKKMEIEEILALER